MNIFGYRSSSVVVSGEGCVFVQVTPVVTAEFPKYKIQSLIYKSVNQIVGLRIF